MSSQNQMRKCICLLCADEWWDNVATLNGRCRNSDCEGYAGFLSIVKKDKELWKKLKAKQIKEQV